MRILKTTILMLVVYSIAFNAFAQQAATVKAEDKYSYLEALSTIDRMTAPIKNTLKENNIDLNFFAGVLQGFDNNVNLDPSRKKDGFLETSLNTEVAYNYTDDIRLRIENYTTDIIYYNVNNANMLDIYNEIGYQVDILDDMFTFDVGYVLEYVYFPCDEDGTYFGNEAGASIRHNIFEDLYQEVGYKFSNKLFSNDTIRNASGDMDSELRRDFRNGAGYEIGYHVMDRAIIRTTIDVYENEGNYEYFDYYDYWSFKVRPSFIVSLTKKLYASGSFTYEQKRYKGRLSTENDEHVYDNTYSFNVSGMYNLSESFIVAVNFGYRENESNEPLQKYSGSIVTAGAYYSF